MKTRRRDLINTFIYKSKEFELNKSRSFNIFKSENRGVVEEVKCSNAIALMTLFCSKNTGLIYDSKVRPQTKMPY